MCRVSKLFSRRARNRVNRRIEVTMGQPYTPYTPNQLDALLELLFGPNCRRGGALYLLKKSGGEARARHLRASWYLLQTSTRAPRREPKAAGAGGVVLRTTPPARGHHGRALPERAREGRGADYGAGGSWAHRIFLLPPTFPRRFVTWLAKTRKPVTASAGRGNAPFPAQTCKSSEENAIWLRNGEK